MDRTALTIGLLKEDDGDAVAALMKKVGFFQFADFPIDWSQLGPNWLGAFLDSDLVGCIQVVPALPIGRIEILCVNPDLSLMMRYRVTAELTNHATATVKMYGAQAVSSMIPRRYADYLNGSARHGWVEIDSGAMVMKRLTHDGQ